MDKQKTIVVFYSTKVCRNAPWNEKLFYTVFEHSAATVLDNLIEGLERNSVEYKITNVVIG